MTRNTEWLLGITIMLGVTGGAAVMLAGGPEAAGVTIGDGGVAIDAGSNPPRCILPSDYGAVPDDGLDDRVAVQTALDVATGGSGCVDLSAGRWDIERRPEIASTAYASLVARGPLRITGGTLAMLGDAVVRDTGTPSDWVLLEVTGEDVIVAGVDFDGSARTITEEQTHLLQVRGPAQRTRIEHSTFNLPDGEYEAGDCIRLFGGADRPVLDTTIRHIQAPDCYRSFIGFQRGVYGVLIEHTQTGWVGDQDIDFEPTGNTLFNCEPIISQVLIQHNVFRGLAGTGISITVAGSGCAVADNVTIRDTVIEGRGIDILDVGRVTLERLRINRAHAIVSQPTILARKRIDSLVIRDSTIVRSANSTVQPVVRISAQSGASPTSVWISNVTIEQHDNKPAIHVEHLKSLVVRNSKLIYSGSPTDKWAINGIADHVTITDTEFIGPWFGAIPMPAILERIEVIP